ncbi:MAG: metallophosphoesterase family protein, partial [Blastochloris sp.]|nr:metallophosphoesterase family protein [Blastochloris sp.]
MKLAILSDIHDQVWNLRAALAHISDAQVDTVLCCGDLCSPFVVGILASGFPGPIHAVSGNNEGDWRQIMVNAASANTSRKADAQIVFHGQFLPPPSTTSLLPSITTPKSLCLLRRLASTILFASGTIITTSCAPSARPSCLIPGTLLGYNPLKPGDL